MHKLYSFILAFVLIPICAFGQIYEPVTWTYSKQQISESKYELIFEADIEEGWAIYSNDIKNNGVDCDIEICPLPVSFLFDESDGFILVDNLIEDKENKKTSFDPIFQMEVTKFSKKAIFRQVIELINDNVIVSGYLTFMTCDDTKCLPPTDVDFKYSFGNVAYNNEPIEDMDSKSIEKNNFILYGVEPEQIIQQDASCNIENETVIINKDRSIINIFLLGLIGGLLALLTPCVFPMIPLTVSFFTKKNENGRGTYNAILYLSLIHI